VYERPSFRRRADVRRLVIALLTPWVLGGLAYSLPLLGRELYRSGFQPDWLGPVTLIWFYSFGFPAMLSVPAWFLFGVWGVAAGLAAGIPTVLVRVAVAVPDVGQPLLGRAGHRALSKAGRTRRCT